MKILIVYYSMYGHVLKLARASFNTWQYME